MVNLIKAEIVVQSHLSDSIFEIDLIDSIEETDSRIKDRLKFVKYIIHKLKGNLNREIDPDKMYTEYKYKGNIRK